MFSLKLYYKDPWIITNVSIVIVLQALLWWYVLSRLHPGNESIFLHYTSIFGVDLVGPGRNLLLLPLFGLLVLLSNFTVGFLVYRTDRFLAQLLASMTTFIQAGIFIAAWFIVGLNI